MRSWLSWPGDERPAVVLAADQRLVGHPDVVVEGGVGRDATDRADRPAASSPRRRWARGTSRGRGASRLLLGIGARREPDVVGVARQAGPHLLAVDHPLVRRRVLRSSGAMRGRCRHRAPSSRSRRRSRRPGSWGRKNFLLLLVRRIRAMVGPTVFRVRKGRGKPAVCTSSAKMNCSIALRPCPVLGRPADPEQLVAPELLHGRAKEGPRPLRRRRAARRRARRSSSSGSSFAARRERPSAVGVKSSSTGDLLAALLRRGA